MTGFNWRPYDEQAAREVRAAREARDRQLAALCALGREIAAHLGDGWTVDPFERAALLRGPAAEVILFGWHGRGASSVGLFGQFPGGTEQADADADGGWLICATGDGPQTIAGRLERDLLPAYRAALAKYGDAVSGGTDAQR